MPIHVSGLLSTIQVEHEMLDEFEIWCQFYCILGSWILVNFQAAFLTNPTFICRWQTCISMAYRSLYLSPCIIYRLLASNQLLGLLYRPILPLLAFDKYAFYGLICHSIYLLHHGAWLLVRLQAALPTNPTFTSPGKHAVLFYLSPAL